MSAREVDVVVVDDSYGQIFWEPFAHYGSKEYDDDDRKDYHTKEVNGI